MSTQWLYLASISFPSHTTIVPVSYTHLRAHETDTSLFVGSVRCVIRDSLNTYSLSSWILMRLYEYTMVVFGVNLISKPYNHCACLLYTSPSPRDGHLSIRRQRQMCNKRQSKYVFIIIMDINAII